MLGIRLRSRQNGFERSVGRSPTDVETSAAWFWHPRLRQHNESVVRTSDLWTALAVGLHGVGMFGIQC